MSPVTPFLALALLPPPDISRENLERHVRFLASDEMKGRDNGTPGGLKASAYVAEQFARIGLKPGGQGAWYHDFAVRKKRGRNVIGRLEGRTDEVVVVAAHHDGLGVKDGKVHNGADDNASGVAVVLELARVLSAERPRRSVLFISFDCEEDGLLGSRAFVKSDLYPGDACAAAFVFDLIGGDFMPWEGRRVYALGSECSGALFARVGRAAAVAKDLDVVRAGIFLLEPVAGMARSDYSSFRSRRVPFVFFSTGTPWTYHTEHDDVGRLNFGKMVKAARFARDVIRETADAATRPDFRRARPHPDDARAMKEALAEVLANRGRLRIDTARIGEVKAMHEKVAALESPDRRVLQRAMTLLFKVARSQGDR